VELVFPYVNVHLLEPVHRCFFRQITEGQTAEADIGNHTAADALALQFDKGTVAGDQSGVFSVFDEVVFLGLVYSRQDAKALRLKNQKIRKSEDKKIIQCDFAPLRLCARIYLYRVRPPRTELR
jgi:hypothetical protein